jgi:hypothetical protein
MRNTREFELAIDPRTAYEPLHERLQIHVDRGANYYFGLFQQTSPG